MARQDYNLVYSVRPSCSDNIRAGSYCRRQDKPFEEGSVAAF
jgi:hypothetical protein